jgi:hypothetical protein
MGPPKAHPAGSVVPVVTESKSTKVSAKKPSAAKAKTSNCPSAGKGWPRKARKPASLPKSNGDAGAQAYIASMEPWQAAIAKGVHALVVKHVPGVRKAVRWHCPAYRMEGQGWFLAFSGLPHHVKFSFQGNLAEARSAHRQIQGRALPGCVRVGQNRREAAGDLDQAVQTYRERIGCRNGTNRCKFLCRRGEVPTLE